MIKDTNLFSISKKERKKENEYNLVSIVRFGTLILPQNGNETMKLETYQNGKWDYQRHEEIKSSMPLIFS